MGIEYDGKLAERFPRSILQIGMAAALLSELIFRVNYAAEFTQFNGFGIFQVPEVQPAGAVEWFSLFNQAPLVGLVLLDAADLVHYLLVALVFLALTAILRAKHRILSYLGFVIALAGTAVFPLINRAFQFLDLSRQYALAPESRQAVMEAAGERILAVYDLTQTGQALWVHLDSFLILGAGLLLSLIMVGNPHFSRLTPILGLIANGVGLLLFPFLIWLPGYFWLPTPISAPFRLIWHLLIGYDLFRIWRRGHG